MGTEQLWDGVRDGISNLGVFQSPEQPQENFEISSALSGQVGKGPTKAPPSLKHLILTLR